MQSETQTDFYSGCLSEEETTRRGSDISKLIGKKSSDLVVQILIKNKIVRKKFCTTDIAIKNTCREMVILF